MPEILFEVIDEDATVDVVIDSPVIDVSAVPDVVSVVTVEGPAGGRGPAGDSAQVFGEMPSGARDGVNTVFTLAQPYQPGSTAVYLNGLREFVTEGYTESSPTTITFTDPPTSADKVRVDYLLA